MLKRLSLSKTTIEPFFPLMFSVIGVEVGEEAISYFDGRTETVQIR